MKRRVLAIGLILGCLAVPLAGETVDWPRWSGPNLDLSTDGSGLTEEGGVALELAWTHQLGPSYAGTVVAGERVMTAFSDGESDFLIALDRADGHELWRHRIAETYKGHDGSQDGVLATPAVGNGTVYALGGWGHLVAVELGNGERLWARRLDQDFGGQKPHWGFTTTPLVLDQAVVVQAGGAEGRSIVALDHATGELLWSTGDDPVGYQSPTLLRVGEEEQILAVNNRLLMGLDPPTGEVLWQHEYGEGGRSLHPVPLGDGQMLLNFQNDAALLRVSRGDGGYEVAEVWRSKAFRRSYAIPVAHDSHIYGYSGQFLTCIDAATGEQVWKSRPPGGGSLMLVDGHLLIQARSGELVVAEASPEGYREKARLRAFESGSLSLSSFAAGRAYVRNMEAIAGIRVRATTAAPSTDETEAIAEADLRGSFGAFIRELEAAEDKKARIDAFLAEHPETPILEDKGLVHLIFHGQVDDLVVTGNMKPGSEADEMHRVAGTDFYFRSYELEPGLIYTYRFAEFEKNLPDPRNPHQGGPERNVWNEIRMPGWQMPAHLAEPETRRGRLEELTWKSEVLENERKIEVYLPPGHDDGDERLPLLIVNSGDEALQQGLMDHTLENLIDRRIASMVVAFVPRLRWSEHAGSGTREYAKAVVEELIPLLDDHYRIRTDRGSRAITGVGPAAFAAMFTALEYPETFSKVGLQSFFDGDLQADLLAMIEGESQVALEIYIEWSRKDLEEPRFNLDAAASSRKLASVLETGGYKVHRVEVTDPAGWASWRTRTDRVLETLFPLVR